jgi:hypothetical protein
MSCPEKDCFMCKMEASLTNNDTIEPYRPRPQYRDSIKTKLWFINSAIVIVFILFMFVVSRK